MINKFHQTNKSCMQIITHKLSDKKTMLLLEQLYLDNLFALEFA